jgi:hypothetical protein
MLQHFLKMLKHFGANNQHFWAFIPAAVAVSAPAAEADELPVRIREPRLWPTAMVLIGSSGHGGAAREAAARAL